MYRRKIKIKHKNKINRQLQKNHKSIKLIKSCIILILLVLYIIFLVKILKVNPFLNTTRNFETENNNINGNNNQNSINNNHKIIENYMSKNNNANNFDGRIFLCTTYNNEEEAAYIHIWRLYDYVDKFIIVASNLTYSLKPKKVTFELYKEKLKPYMDKVDLVNYDNVCNRKLYPHDNLIW